jgi:hypothetical protein
LLDVIDREISGHGANGDPDMVTEHELGLAVQAALSRAGFQPFTFAQAGYVIGPIKTLSGPPIAEIDHYPREDDPDSHAKVYFAALNADPDLAGLDVQLIDQPYVRVQVRG